MSYKDYGKQDWLKVLGITEEKVPELLVIEGSILIQRRLAERQKLLTNLTTIRYPNIITGEVNGIQVTITIHTTHGRDYDYHNVTIELGSKAA